MDQDDDDRRVDLYRAFDEQVRLLSTACILYDAGDFSQAKVMSDRLSCLCYDGKRSRSLLSRLGLCDVLRVFSPVAAMHQEELLLSLAYVACDACGDRDHVWWVPRFGSVSGQRLLSFSEWWDEVIFETAEAMHLSRQNLVRSMRNQDSSHVDDRLKDQAYASVRRKGSRHVTYVVQDDAITILAQRFSRSGRLDVVREVPPAGSHSPSIDDLERRVAEGAHLAMMRHIAWELLDSLQRAGPLDIKLAGILRELPPVEAPDLPAHFLGIKSITADLTDLKKQASSA